MKLNNPLNNLTLKLTNKCMYLENGVECEKMSEEEAEASIRDMANMMDFYDEILKCKCGWKGKRNDLSFDNKKSTFNCPKCNFVFDN